MTAPPDIPHPRQPDATLSSTLFTNPDVAARNLGLWDGCFSVFRAEDRQGFAEIALIERPLSIRTLYRRHMMGPVSGQIPWSGVTGRNVTPTLLDRLADKVFGARWDVLDLGPYPEFDSVTREFSAICKARAPQHKSYDGFSFGVQGPGTIDLVLDAQSATTRKNLRRLIPRLERTEGGRAEFLTGVNALSGFARFAEIDRHSWKADHGETISSSDALYDFYHGMIGDLARQGNAVVTIVQVDGRDVAGTLGFIHNGVGYTMKSSFLSDDTYEALSPGRLSNLLSIKWMLETAGLNFVSLLSSAEYARWLSNTQTAIHYHHIWHPRLRSRLSNKATALISFISRKPMQPGET